MKSPPGELEYGQADDVRPNLEPDSLFVELMPPHADGGRTKTGQASTGSGRHRLIPRRPPGRSNRKARVFAEEIRRLRAEGYGLEVIREALADAGVVVSKSTVQREAARGPSSSQSAPISDTAQPPG